MKRTETLKRAADYGFRSDISALDSLLPSDVPRPDIEAAYKLGQRAAANKLPYKRFCDFWDIDNEIRKSETSHSNNKTLFTR